MLIRPARVEDAAVLAQAEYDTASEQEGLLAAKPGEIPVEAFRRTIESLREDGLYVVLEVEGRPAGHLLLEPFPLSSTNHVAQLTIVVHHGYTGRGYGRALMEHAIEWARRSERIEKIELRVRSSNPRAIGLYEALGFKTEGRLQDRIKLQNGYADDICMALFVRDTAA
jgi:RimJ/RimL family protein N-acetyltransferase